MDRKIKDKSRYLKTEIISKLAIIINNIPKRLLLFSPSVVLTFQNNQKIISKPFRFITIENILSFLDLIKDDNLFEFRLIYENKKLEYILIDYGWEQLEYATEYVRRKQPVDNNHVSIFDYNFNDLAFTTKVLKTNDEYWDIDDMKDKFT